MEPAWGWSGVKRITFREPAEIRSLLQLLPSKTAPADDLIPFLADLAGRFPRWLHQDEFGPSRAHQTAALRALRRSLKLLDSELARLTPLRRDWLDGKLKVAVDPSFSMLWAFHDATDWIAADLKRTGARGSRWVTQLLKRSQTATLQVDLLDTNTESAIFDTTLKRKFDLQQVAGGDFSLAHFTQWLTSYREIVCATLSRLNKRRGPEQALSLKLLVFLLCGAWGNTTEEPVIANGTIQDRYRSKAVTKSGEFVTAAVEAMLPDQGWLNEHAQFSTTARSSAGFGLTPGDKDRRAGQILPIMKSFRKLTILAKI